MSTPDTPTYDDAPFGEIAAAMKQLLDEAAADTNPILIFPKWTCTGCGDRVMATDPNTLHSSYRHEDCGAVTDVTVTGLNYAVVSAGSAGGMEAIQAMLKDRGPGGD